LKSFQPKSILKNSEAPNNVKFITKNNSTKYLLGYNINTKTSDKQKRHANSVRISQRYRNVSTNSSYGAGGPIGPQASMSSNMVTPNVMQGAVNTNVAKRIMRNNTVRETHTPYNVQDEIGLRPSAKYNEFRLIKSNSADNLCNRSIQHNKKVMLKTKINSQELFKDSHENFMDKAEKGNEKEKDKDSAEKVKIIKTSDITSDETTEISDNPNKETIINIDPMNNGGIYPTKEEIKDLYEEPASYKPISKHLSTYSRRRSTFYGFGGDNELSSYSISERNRSRLLSGNSQFFQQQQMNQLRKQCRFSIIALSKDANNEGANIKIPLNNNSADDNNFIIGHSTDPSVLLNLNITKSNSTNKHSAVVVRKPTDLLKIGQTKFICYCYIIITFLTIFIVAFCIITIYSWTKIRTRSKVKTRETSYSPDKMIVMNVSLLYFVIGSFIQVVITMFIIYSYIYSFNVVKKTLYKNE